jgi:DNA-directed RNA polymerase specialized sigma24 family protein
MTFPEKNDGPNTALGAQFAATSWTNVLAAQQAGSPEGAAALEKLCGVYWYPLYAYLRRRGFDSHKAQDLTQEFLYRLIKENYLGAADRRRGKFRSFLLAALNHFVSNQRDYERAVKRGGRVNFISLDDTESESRFAQEPTAAGLSPEKIFERNWFLALFDEALARLRAEQLAAGRAEVFDQLKQFVVEDAEAGDYGAVAARVNMTPNGVAVAVHRLRERYKKLVHEEVVRTVAELSEIGEELHRFFAVMAE